MINVVGNWIVISLDLINGLGGGNLIYGIIILIDVFFLNLNKIIVGIDDGNVWII